jgi:hypothetical protein
VPSRLLAGFDTALVAMEKRCAAPELLPWRSVRDADVNGLGQGAAGRLMGDDDASNRRHDIAARSGDDGGD